MFLCVCSEDTVGEILLVYVNGFAWINPENLCSFRIQIEIQISYVSESLNVEVIDKEFL